MLATAGCWESVAGQFECLRETFSQQLQLTLIVQPGRSRVKRCLNKDIKSSRAAARGGWWLCSPWGFFYNNGMRVSPWALQQTI